MRRLLVIGQVDVVDKKATRNRSLNIKLNHYARHFDKVFYFGPRQSGGEAHDEVNAEFRDTDVYSRTGLGRLTFMASRRLYGELDHLVQELQPDLIQIRVPGPFTIRAGLHLKRKHAKKMFCYVAGDVTESVPANFPLPGIRFVSEAMARWQDRLLDGLPVVAAGDALRNKLMTRHDGKLRCHAYYATTHDRVLYSKHRRNELLVIGRLEPLKRPRLAIEALGELHRQGFNDFTLRFLGEGPLKDSLSHLAESLYLKDHVIFHGYERNSEVLRNIYLQAKFLVHPSMTEGTSKVLAEAMAHGVIPIAIRDVGSNNQILASGAGFLTAEDPTEIAGAILDCEMDERLYLQKLKKGYDYAKCRTLEKEVRRLFCFLNTEQRNT